MMQRASLVVVLLLLASVGTASAECAWVLWAEYDSFLGANTWEILSTTVSRGDCHTQESVEAQALVKVVKSGEWRAWWGGTRPIPRRYLCLPDTIDPRGPKGK